MPPRPYAYPPAPRQVMPFNNPSSRTPQEWSEPVPTSPDVQEIDGQVDNLPEVASKRCVS